MPNPGTIGSFLIDVAAASPSDVWAVGYGWNGSNDLPAVQHWDGVRWNLVQVPRPHGTDAFLYGVSALATDDVWIVGYANLASSRTLIEHWDGAQWTIVPSPNPSAIYNRLFNVAVIGPNDVWAVGSAFLDFEQSLALHWDGVRWRVVKTPDLGTGVNQLSAVAGNVTDDVWAVGDWTNGHDAVTQTLIEHWDGTAWSPVRGFKHQSQSNFLTGVSEISPSAVLTTGARRETLATLALQWDGAAWSFKASEQVPQTVNRLNDVSADAAGNAWTVGYYYLPGDSQSQTLIERWDGSAWHIVPSPNEGSVSSLWGVLTVSASEAWAVGWSESDDALIEHYCA